MREIPEIHCGVFLGVEETGDGETIALQFEHVVVVISASCAKTIGYMLSEQ